MKHVILWLRRLLVFGLGVILAAAVTYGVAAYVIFPRAIRIGLRILQRGHVPSYTITSDGLPGDPVNLALIGTVKELEGAFAAAGWAGADPLSAASSWRMARSFVLNRPYPTAPFSTLYLFGRGQDFGFQRAIDNSPRKDITSGFGVCRWTASRKGSIRLHSGATRIVRPIASAFSGWVRRPRIPDCRSPD
jgi:hypothetical protein